MCYNVSFKMYATQVFGIITGKYSMFVLCATLIFTCGQWNRWCEGRICHAWLSSTGIFLSTFGRTLYVLHAAFAECFTQV